MAKAVKKDSFSLDTLPPETVALRVKNVTGQPMVFRGINADDLVLGPFREKIVAAGPWVKNRFLRDALAKFQVVISVADEYDSPKELPNLDDAPVEAQCETAFDRNYAWHALTTDNESETIEMLNELSTLEDGTVNINFMKTRMKKILHCVQWAEPQVQNRKRVLAAIKERLDYIRAL